MEVYYIPLNHLYINFMQSLNGICLIKWYNNNLDEQGSERRGLLSQIDDETGSHCVNENAYA